MKRGDLVTVAPPGDFGRPRPAVIVQSDLFANHTTLAIVPVTSTSTPASPLFRLSLSPSEQNGLRTPSDVMVDRMMSVRARRIGETIGRLDGKDMRRISQALARFLGITP